MLRQETGCPRLQLISTQPLYPELHDVCLHQTRGDFRNRPSPIVCDSTTFAPIRKLLQMLKDHEISSGLHHMARYSAKIRDLEGTLDLGQLRN
jgi:hypothetical protein